MSCCMEKEKYKVYVTIWNSFFYFILIKPYDLRYSIRKRRVTSKSIWKLGKTYVTIVILLLYLELDLYKNLI